MTKYKEIVDQLRTNIYEGVFPALSKLPEQTALAKRFQTSRMTIQKALNQLKQEGLISTKRGHGTYVNSATYQGQINEYIGLVNRYGGRHKVQSKIISFNVRFPEANEMDYLSLRENEPVYDIIRLRYVDNEPFELEYTIMPIKTIPDIDMAILEHSIYRYITDSLHLKIGPAIRKIRADKADSYDIKYLEVDPNDPILELEQVARLSDGRPFEFSQTRYPYQNREITIFLNLNGKKTSLKKTQTCFYCPGKVNSLRFFGFFRRSLRADPNAAAVAKDGLDGWNKGSDDRYGIDHPVKQHVKRSKTELLQLAAVIIRQEAGK